MHAKPRVGPKPNRTDDRSGTERNQPVPRGNTKDGNRTKRKSFERAKLL